MAYGYSQERQRLDRGAAHLQSLGPRATAEFLWQVAESIGGLPCILGLLEQYARLTPGMVRAVGGDRFSPAPLRKVPRDMGRAA